MPPDHGDAGAQRAARLPPYLRSGFGPYSGGAAPNGFGVTDPLGGPDPPADDTQPRPFVLTAGRVAAPDQDISLETQVTSNYDPGTARYATATLPSELRAIVTLCDVPMSVAEISARLRLHLGVTRILVGDLRAAGHLEIHHLSMPEHHSPETILRVIRGLRAIN
jgi:hypothetical protein